MQAHINTCDTRISVYHTRMHINTCDTRISVYHTRMHSNTCGTRPADNDTRVYMMQAQMGGTSIMSYSPIIDA